MASVTPSDIRRMADNLFIDGPVGGRKSSKFWILLSLAAVIATAGVVADSTATVIGAMIVAPLMTPILGTALAVVLADRRHVLRSVSLVVGGALLVVAIGFAIGLVDAPLDAFAANTQVAGRISPRLIDLLAALATGTVGAFALVRSDISDTLPGVAIAISLVPPLAVVGLLLSVERYADAGGALLLFGTNVAAIIATGTAVLIAYRVRDAARDADYPLGPLRGRTLALVGATGAGGRGPAGLRHAVGGAGRAADGARQAGGRRVGERQQLGRDDPDRHRRPGRDHRARLSPEADVTTLRRAFNDNGLADAAARGATGPGRQRDLPCGRDHLHAVDRLTDTGRCPGPADDPRGMTRRSSTARVIAGEPRPAGGPVAGSSRTADPQNSRFDTVMRPWANPSSGNAEPRAVHRGQRHRIGRDGRCHRLADQRELTAPRAVQVSSACRPCQSPLRILRPPASPWRLGADGRRRPDAGDSREPGRSLHP